MSQFDSLSRITSIGKRTLAFGTVDNSYDYIYTKQIGLGAAVVENQIVGIGNYHVETIGNDFFKNFILTIDWPNKEVLLSPVLGIKKATFNSFGLSLGYDNGKVIVRRVIKHSPADKSGLKIGTQVLKLNEMDYQSISLEKYCKMNLIPSGLDKITILVNENGIDRLVNLEKVNLLPTKK